MIHGGLLVAAVVFALLAWLVPDPLVKKVSTVVFVICAVVLVVLILLQVVASQNMTFG